MKEINYGNYMEIFAARIETLHQAVRAAQEDGPPEDYDHAVRLLIHDVIWTVSQSDQPTYTIEDDVWLP